MQIQKSNNETVIILSQAFDSRLKMLNLIYGLVFFLSGDYFVFNLLQPTFDDTATKIFEICFSIAMYFACYRFFNKALLIEKLYLNEHELRWVEKGLFKSKTISFDLKEIANLRFVEKGAMAPHPLAGQSMDYLGFQTTEKMVNQLAGDNQIAFDYKGQVISFGADIYSYEFDEIKSIFDKYE